MNIPVLFYWTAKQTRYFIGRWSLLIFEHKYLSFFNIFILMSDKTEDSPDPPASSSPTDPATEAPAQTPTLQTMIDKLSLQEQPPTPPAEQKSPEPADSTELTETKYFVQINRPNIMFGKSTLFPGSIEQIDVSIGLKDEIIEDNGNNPFMLRVIARCTNVEFNDLDEYVFSVRSNERFEYFEEVRFKIRKKERAQVKVAVKIPPVRQNYAVQGYLQIQLESLVPVCLPIYAKCEVPQIQCVKDLYKPDEDTPIIKIPAKKNQIRMPPIPFKNLSNFNFTLQVEAISNENFSTRPYDIITQNFVNVQANTQFFVNLQLKENMSYKATVPAKDYIRKILLLKIKGSSIYYNYPMEIFIFEGSNNASGMS